jgi:hypothetical protein
MVLTTWDAVRHGDDKTRRPEFNSLNYLNQIKTLKEHGVDEWAVKIFSSERITDEWLERLFGKGQVGWVFRKEVTLFARHSHHIIEPDELVYDMSGMPIPGVVQRPSSRH